MFRKTINIITAIILLTATTGVVVSKHYCGDNLMSVAIGSGADTCCDAENCCHVETEGFQLNTDFIFATGQINFKNDFSVDLSFLQNLLSGNFNELVKTDKYIVTNNSSPPVKIQSLLSRLQTYLL